MADYNLHWSRKPYNYVDPMTGEEIARPNAVAWRQFESMALRANWENSLIPVLVMGFAKINETKGRMVVPRLILPVLEHEKSFLADASGIQKEGKIGKIFGSVEVFVHDTHSNIINIVGEHGGTVSVTIQDL